MNKGNSWVILIKTCGSGPLLHMACPSSHRCGYRCCSVRATTSHYKKRTYECCSSQSWFCINRWTDLLVDIGELIEVYLIYAHPNFHTYSYFVQFNIHLFLKSIQKLQLQNVTTSNREHIQFRSRNTHNWWAPQSQPGLVQIKSRANKHTYKLEIAAMKAWNFHMTLLHCALQHIHTHTYIYIYISQK